jgi:hypothetical protein
MDLEVAGYCPCVMQRLNDEIYAVDGHNRVRVQKPQHVSLGSARSPMHLRPTSAFGGNDLRAKRTGNLARIVIASAVHDYDFYAT